MKLLLVLKKILKQWLVIILVIVGVFLLYNQDNKLITSLEMSVLDSTSYIMSSSSALTNNLDAIQSTASEFINLHAKYKELQLENQLLKDKALTFQQILFENEELRRLNNVTLPKAVKIATTRIISRFDDSHSNTAVILAGKKQHVEAGQVIVNGNGVIGRVVNVGEKVSKIMLLTDASSKIPGFFPRSKEHGIIVGENNKLSVKYLAQSTKIIVGDLVLTSGDGALFPYGLPIGVVSSMKNGNVIITSFYDPSKLDLVSVLSY